MTTVSTDGSGARERTWLVFRLGPYVMCASALDVEGIIQCPEAIAKFPLAPDYVLGAFIFRGRGAAAVSLRKKLKLTQGEDRATGPFIVARIGEAVVAFWVDEVKDVIAEKDVDWRPIPSTLERGLFERFGIRERELILQTSFAALREAKVEFESFAVWAASHAAAGAVPAASAVQEAPTRAVRTARGSECHSEPEPAERSTARAADEQTNGLPSAAVAAHSSTALAEAAPREVAADSRAAAAAKRPSAHLNAGGRLRAARGSTEHAAWTSSATARIAAPPPRMHGPSGITGASVVPAGNVPPSNDRFDAQQATALSRRRSAAGRVTIVTGIAIAALAAILYGLLRESSRDGRPAPISRAVAMSSSGNAISPEAAPRADPPAKQVVSVRAGAVVLTIEHPADKAAGRPELEDTADAAGAAGTTADSDARIHRVVRGDTLWQIAKKQVGDPFQYRELAKLSNISNPDLIHPGDIVRIEIRESK